MVPSRNLLDRKRCICFSIGYFLYDSLLSIANYRKYPDRLEIIIHHLITTITLGQIFCPIIRVRFPKLIDYCSYGLVIEISNIFIHIRSLGYISDFWSNNLLLFKLNSFLAIGKRNWFNWFIFLLFFFLSLSFVINLFLFQSSLRHRYDIIRGYTSFDISIPIPSIIMDLVRFIS